MGPGWGSGDRKPDFQLQPQLSRENFWFRKAPNPLPSLLLYVCVIFCWLWGFLYFFSNKQGLHETSNILGKC